MDINGRFTTSAEAKPQNAIPHSFKVDYVQFQTQPEITLGNSYVGWSRFKFGSIQLLWSWEFRLMN